MSPRFESKTVLVTRSSSGIGIGLATAQAFVAEGATVIITGRDAAALEAAHALIGPSAIAIRNDAVEIAAGKALATAVRSQIGPHKLSGIFLNAGIAKFAPLADVTEAV